MGRTRIRWLLCSIASALVVIINLSNAIEAVHISGHSRSVEGNVKLLGIDTSKVSTKNGSVILHSARLTFIGKDGKIFPLSEFPDRPFTSSNWTGLNEDIKQLTSQDKVTANCSSISGGCFIHADASGFTKVWLMLSVFALACSVWLLLSVKKKDANKFQS